MPVADFVRDYTEAAEDAKKRNEEIQKQLKSRQRFRKRGR